MACFLFQQRHGQQFPIYRAVAGEGAAIGAADQTGQVPWHLVVACQRGHCLQFLADPVQPERGQIVALEHQADVTADERAGRRAAREGVLQHGRVDARALSQQQRLRGGDRLAEPQQVDQQFDGVPGPVPAGVHDPARVAENFQQGAVPFHRARLTADEQLQLPLTGGRDPTAHRRLKDLHTLLHGLFPDGPGGGRGVAGHIDPGRAAGQPFQGAGLPQHRRMHLAGPWQHGDQHARCRGCLRGRVPPDRPARHGGFLRLGALIGRGDLIPALTRAAHIGRPIRPSQAKAICCTRAHYPRSSTEPQKPASTEPGGSVQPCHVWHGDFHR